MQSNSLTSTFLSESVAEDLAETFLINYFGCDLFIIADIERVLAEQVNIGYQDFDDSNYSGAAISY